MKIEKVRYRFKNSTQFFSKKNYGYISLVVILVVLLGALLAGGLTTSYNAEPAIVTPTLPIISGPTNAIGSSGCLHVQGAQIIDCNGSPVMLRGAMMESSFAYINKWQGGQDPTQILNTTTFT